MQALPNLFFIIAPLVVLVFLPVLLFGLSRMGWASIARNYRHSGGYAGTRVGIISAAVNGGNYKNSLLLKYGPDGFYLRPIFIFRIFHPPVLVPWTAIVSVNDRSVLRGNTKELVIGEPEVARITILESTYAKIEHAVPANIRRER